MNSHLSEKADEDTSFNYTISTANLDESSSKGNNVGPSFVSTSGPKMPPTGNATMPMSLLHNAMFSANDVSQDTEADKKERSRKNRLEQNRKAARESRRRKKMMIDELQRSVIFFTRANAALRQQYSDLLRRTTEAQRIVTALECAKSESTAGTGADQENNSQQGSELCNSLKSSSMRIGATMKAMASFQEAASAAMQSAMKGLIGINAQHLSEPSDTFETKLAVTDTMTVLAMENAEASPKKSFDV